MAILHLTETKNVDIWTNCIDNPIFLMWYDSLGGANYWCFGFSQQRGLSTVIGAIKGVTDDDLETAESQEEYIDKTSQPGYVIGANNLTTQQILGLESLLSCTRVLMLLNPDTWQDEGCKWVRIGIDAGSWKTEVTDQELHDIEFAILLPRTNFQTQ